MSKIIILLEYEKKNQIGKKENKTSFYYQKKIVTIELNLFLLH